MGSILIRQLDDDTKSKLRLRAARSGHSMEQERRVRFCGDLLPLKTRFCI